MYTYCPTCGTAMVPNDGGPGYNYELEDVWWCPECEESWEEADLDELDAAAHPEPPAPDPGDELPF